MEYYNRWLSLVCTKLVDKIKEVFYKALARTKTLVS